jgi:intein-encoded DNA endonuclease-like protein
MKTTSKARQAVFEAAMKWAKSYAKGFSDKHADNVCKLRAACAAAKKAGKGVGK